jgi:hypothetical protein
MVAKNGRYLQMVDGVAIKVEPRHCTSPPTKDQSNANASAQSSPPARCPITYFPPTAATTTYFTPHHNGNAFIRIL